ncbi:MAG: tetratricopeptide repeat protein [Bacteroidia bacterium]
MKKTILTLIFLVPICIRLLAQDAVQAAFERSYSLEKTGNYSGAIAEIKTVYRAGDYESNLRLGYLHYEAGLYSESTSYYSKAILLMPHSIEARLGYVYPSSMLGKWDDVLRQYQEILKLDPQNTNVNYKVGYIFYTRKNYPEAYKHFELVIKLYPFDYDGNLMIAWTNLQLGKMKDAKFYFKRVMLLSPNDKSATEGLGLIK